MRLFKINDTETYNIDLIYKIVKTEYIANTLDINLWEEYIRKYCNNKTLHEIESFDIARINNTYKYMLDNPPQDLVNQAIAKIGEKPYPIYDNQYEVFLTNGEQFTIDEKTYDKIIEIYDRK